MVATSKVLLTQALFCLLRKQRDALHNFLPRKKSSTQMGTAFLAMDYKRDVLGSLVNSFEISQKTNQ